MEGEVLALVNAERAKAGCGPVGGDAGLASVARAHSADMRDRGFFDHVNPDGVGPFDRADRAGVSARAENIARGQSGPAAVMTSWMNSPGHRANILNCGLTRLGVGVATGSGGPWWTQLFG
ncbi:CAP domain-containing protein [Blastococcus sp. SYSU DS0669]